jgi:hypothetical protein
MGVAYNCYGCIDIDCEEEIFNQIKDIFETHKLPEYELIITKYGGYQIKGSDGDKAADDMAERFIEFLKDVTSKIQFNGELGTCIYGKIIIDYPEYFSALDVRIIAIDMNTIEASSENTIHSQNKVERITTSYNLSESSKDFFSDGEKVGYVLAQCKYCDNNEFMSWNDSRDGILPSGYKRCEYCAYDICGGCVINERYLHKPNNEFTNMEHFCTDCWSDFF